MNAQEIKEPDYNHYWRLPLWSSWEVIHLFSGIDPEWANNTDNQNLIGGKNDTLNKVIDIFNRSSFFGLADMHDPDIPPEQVLSFARTRKMDIPKRLQELSGYAQKDEQKQENAALVREREQVRQLLEENRELRIQLGEQTEQKDKGITPRERQSVEKLVVSMAIRGYGHDLTKKRSDTVPTIQSDMAELGFEPLDDATIRKWIRKGAELLPEKEAI